MTRAVAARATPLLAKFSQPGTARPVERQRLFARLDAQRHCPLIWVAGPPGAGKTALVSTYLARDKSPALWFRVDEGDADVATFFSYLTQAGASFNPKLAKKLPSLTTEHVLDMAGFCREYFRELFAGLPPGCALVFDGIETARNGALDALLPLATAVLPPGMRLVITSRSEPPASVAHLLVTGELAQINAKELLLMPQEAADIAAVDVAALPVSVDALHQASGGWVTGFVVMLAHTRRTGSATLTMDGSLKESFFSYFVNELFKNADAAARELLIRTAVMPVFTAAQAASLCAWPDAQDVLQHLYRQNFFINCTLGPNGPDASYHYHALFRSFLLEQGRRLMDGPQRQQLLIQAATLLVQTRAREEACHLLIEAQAWTAAGSLLCDLAPDLWRQGRVNVLDQLIAALPVHTLDELPWLFYWLGMARQLPSPQLGRALLTSSLTRFKAQNNPQAALTVCSAALESLTLDFSDMHPIDPWALEYGALTRQLDQDAGLAAAAADAGRNYASLGCTWLRADLHVDLLERGRATALHVVAHTNDPVDRITAAIFVCWLLVFRGEMEAVRRVISQVDARLVATEIPPIRLIMWCLVKAWPAQLEADVELAGSLCKQAGALALGQGIQVFDVLVASHGVYPALIAGDVAQAEMHARNMATSLVPGRVLDGANYDWVMACIALARGDARRSLELARAGLAKATACGANLFVSHCRMAVAYAQLALGQASDALVEVNHLVAFATTAKFSPYEHTGLMIKAGALLQMGSAPEAHSALRSALEMGRQRGYVIVFPLAPVAFLQSVYAAALDAGIETDYVLGLIRKLKLVPPAGAGPHWPWRVKVHTLGRFEIKVDGLPVEYGRKAPKRPLALLKLLIAQRGSLRMDAASDALWPDEDADAGARSLDVALHRLRRLLGDGASIELQDGMLQLDARSLWVDALALDDALDLADQGGKSARSIRLDAMKQYGGHFLHDQPEAWAGAARERLRARFNRAAAAHGRELEDAKRFEEATSHYTHAVEIDAQFEAAYQGLMRCHLARGWHSEGLACFERLRLSLLAFGGLRPLAASASLRDLLEAA